MLYEALTGIAPFARKEADTEPEMPEGLDEVIERAVAKDPAERYPSAGALIAAAREREGAGMAATQVLSEPAGGRPAASARRRPRAGRAGRGRAPRARARRALIWLGAGAVGDRGVVVLALLLGGGGVEVSEPIAVGARAAAGRRRRRGDLGDERSATAP